MIIAVIMVQWRACDSDNAIRRRGIAILELNLHCSIYFYRIGADNLLVGDLRTDHLRLLKTHLLIDRLVVWYESRDDRLAMLYNGVEGCSRRALDSGRASWPSLHWKSMANWNRLPLLVVHHCLRASLGGSRVPYLIRRFFSETHAFFTLKLAHYVFTS